MPTKTRTNLTLAVVALLSLPMAACSTTEFMASGPQLVSGGTGGSDASALFDGPEAAEFLDAVGGPGALPEYARRDESLAVTGPSGPLLATNQWPTPARPDLDYTRTLYLPNGNGQYQVINYASDRPYTGPSYERYPRYYVRPYGYRPGYYGYPHYVPRRDYREDNRLGPAISPPPVGYGRPYPY